MMKFITTIAAFSLTFILSVALVGFPKETSSFNLFQPRTINRTQDNILSLLTVDISNGVKRDQKIYDYAYSDNPKNVSGEYAEIINEYVDASSSLDDSQMPEDFQLAWQNHMHAWRQHASFLNQSKHFCHLRKMSDSDFTEIYNRQDAEITRTWRKVLSVAGKYGATVPYQYQ